MKAQLFDNTFRTFFDSKKLGNPQICFSTDIEIILIEKNNALSSMNFLEDEAEHFNEDDELLDKKVKKLNSNCYLVSCVTENSDVFPWNESTNDI